MKKHYNSISSAGLSLFSGLLSWAPRLLIGVVGLILLISGLLKATDINLFVKQVRDYEIISHNVLLVVTAWSVIVAEFTLGMSLILSFLTKWTIPLTAFLLFIFLGATAWAWFTGVTEDCGCFGAWVKRSPGEAMIEDLVLLVALIPAWLGKGDSAKPVNHIKFFAVIVACVAGLILPPLFGSPISQISGTVPASTNIQQEFLEIQDILQMDIRHGAYLFVLMSTDCLHCRDAFKRFNIWAEETDIPPLIALCANNKEQIQTFKTEFQPKFPVLQITEDKFWDLLELSTTPRIFLMRNGGILKIWEGEAPDTDRIREALVQ